MKKFKQLLEDEKIKTDKYNSTFKAYIGGWYYKNEDGKWVDAGSKSKMIKLANNTK